MNRISYDKDKKGYQILHPCKKCEQWNEIFIPESMEGFSYDKDKNGYQILHPCEKCKQWDEIFLPQSIVKLSEYQIVTDKREKKRLFYTSLDPKFQSKIAKGIRALAKAQEIAERRRKKIGGKKMKKEEHERRMSFALQTAATAWCGEKTKGKTIDADLAEEFAKILVAEMYKPHLGCARTRELIDEIRARIEVSGELDYRTIDSD